MQKTQAALLQQADLPPFEFGPEGIISISDATLEIDGTPDFVKRYVSEWLLWNSPGKLNAKWCDIAALTVATLHCRYLPRQLSVNLFRWLEQTFFLFEPGSGTPVRLRDYSAQTLTALRALRVAIPAREESPDVNDAANLIELAQPIEKMLVLGGDQRLLVDRKSLLNGYGCRPFPRPEAITFSSSTATSISQYAFDLVDKRRRQLIADAIENGMQSACAVLANEVRDDLCRQLGITPAIAEPIIAASGTDCFLITHGIIRLIADKPMTTLIIGIEESGSGVKLALQEKHFADDTALANEVHKGEPLCADIHFEHQIDVPIRTASGEAIPLRYLDKQVKELIEQGVQAGHHMALHAMDHSKLGYSGPSKSLLIELKQRFENSVTIVVDACQMRLDKEDIVEYLENELIVIITGSKFFTGPPFCGAILLPEQLVSTIEKRGATLGAGFDLYCAQNDFSPRLKKAIGAGCTQNVNLGSLLRWTAAIHEMKRYYEIPPLVRVKAMVQFCARIEDILLDTPFIELQYQYAPERESTSIQPGELSGRRMIFPFFLYIKDGSQRKLCNEQQVREIYTLLNQDCSTRIAYANAREYRLLAQMCHIGQPVSVMHRSGVRSAVLRINVGARIFSESYSKTTGKIIEALIEDEIWQVGNVLGKIDLLLGQYTGASTEMH